MDDRVFSDVSTVLNLRITWPYWWSCVLGFEHHVQSLNHVTILMIACSRIEPLTPPCHHSQSLNHVIILWKIECSRIWKPRSIHPLQSSLRSLSVRRTPVLPLRFPAASVQLLCTYEGMSTNFADSWLLVVNTSVTVVRNGHSVYEGHLFYQCVSLQLPYYDSNPPNLEQVHIFLADFEEVKKQLSCLRARWPLRVTLITVRKKVSVWIDYWM